MRRAVEHHAINGKSAFAASSIAIASSIAALGCSLEPATCPDSAWSRRFGDAADQAAGYVAVDAGCDLYVAGGFQGRIDLGDGALAADAPSAFLAKLGPSGATVWSRKLDDWVTSVATNRRGDAVVAGVRFASGAVMRLDSKGDPAWPEPVAAGNGIGPVAIDEAGEIVLVALVTDGPPQVTKLDASGARVFTVALDGFDDPVTGDLSLAIDGAGDVAVSGLARPQDGVGSAFVRLLDPTGATLSSLSPGGTSSVRVAASPSSGFLVAHDAGQGSSAIASVGAHGETSWSRTIASPVPNLAMDDAGDAYLYDELTTTVDFGGGALGPRRGGDLYLVELDARGDHVASRRFDATAAFASAVFGVDAGGRPFVGGGFAGAIDLGAGELTSAGGNDAFVASVDLPRGLSDTSPRR